MKLLSVICIGFVLLFACKEDRNVEVGAQTSMVFKSTVYNAGTVYKGEVIRAVFEVENTGDHPLVFGEVRPSCSCTVAKKPNKPLMPGKSTKIIAEVNTADLHTKRIHKVVTVMTNTSPNITPLEIKGRIK
ncbi:MAG: DUF1573 domain-containing protein [Flavobacteriia bacterium]|jgi:hypothetical protein|nr:DUF1573 domain-containing protein [Cryomorphaceae bacterium]